MDNFEEVIFKAKKYTANFHAFSLLWKIVLHQSSESFSLVTDKLKLVFFSLTQEKMYFIGIHVCLLDLVQASRP